MSERPEDRGSFLLYEATLWASRATLTLGFSFRTRGFRHIPPKGPCLLLANHQSYLDPVILGVAARRHISFLARKTLFRQHLFGWLIRGLNAVPIDQEGVGIEGLRIVMRMLKEGRAVVVFPEGHRTSDGQVKPLMPGLQLLINKIDTPVVPVGIAGAFQSWPRWSPLPIPAPLFLPPGKGTLAVVFGQAVESPSLREISREDLLERYYQQIRDLHQQAERLRRKDG